MVDASGQIPMPPTTARRIERRATGRTQRTGTIGRLIRYGTARPADGLPVPVSTRPGPPTGQNGDGSPAGLLGGHGVHAVKAGQGGGRALS